MISRRYQGIDEYQTAVGELGTIMLRDGSEVTLNTDTRIRIRWEPDAWRIELALGEAHLRTADDPSRSLVAHAADVAVTSVAAEFSVRLLSGEVQVFVTRGTAHLRCFDAATSTPPAILHAETVARVGSRLIVYQPSQAESERLSSWRRGLLIFHATALADAVAEFNRYCLHNLVIVDPSIAQIRIGGQFRYTNVDAFLALLQQGFPIVAEQSGNQLILRRRT